MGGAMADNSHHRKGFVLAAIIGVILYLIWNSKANAVTVCDGTSDGSDCYGIGGGKKYLAPNDPNRWKLPSDPLLRPGGISCSTYKPTKVPDSPIRFIPILQPAPPQNIVTPAWGNLFSSPSNGYTPKVYS
jgi:hypothetical protein